MWPEEGAYSIKSIVTGQGNISQRWRQIEGVQLRSSASGQCIITHGQSGFGIQTESQKTPKIV